MQEAAGRMTYTVVMMQQTTSPGTVQWMLQQQAPESVFGSDDAASNSWATAGYAVLAISESCYSHGKLQLRGTRGAAVGTPADGNSTATRVTVTKHKPSDP